MGADGAKNRKQPELDKSDRAAAPAEGEPVDLPPDFAVQKWRNDCDLYKSEREAYTKEEGDAEKRFDGWIITLAGGALGLSITFVDKMVHKNPPVGSWAIFVAWMLFAASVLSVLINTRLSPVAHDKFRAILDRQFRPDKYYKDDDVWSRIRKKQAKVRLLGVMDVFNIASLAFFVAGVVFLSVFVYRNLA